MRCRGRSGPNAFLSCRSSAIGGCYPTICRAKCQSSHRFSYGTLNKVLYAHVREAHLRDLLARYEQAEADLAAYQEACCEYAKAFLQRLTEELAIPVGSDFAPPYEPGRLFRSLGLFVLERHLGMTQPMLRLNPRGPFPWYEAHKRYNSGSFGWFRAR